MLEGAKKQPNWQDKGMELIENHMLFLKITISLILIYVGFFLYTIDRSFRVHQNTLSRILRWNNRQGIFCSRVHVGHDGTTLDFQTVPKEVGTAGTIDSSSLSGSPVDQFEIIPLLDIKIRNFFFSFINPSLFMPLTVSLVLLLLVFFVPKVYRNCANLWNRQKGLLGRPKPPVNDAENPGGEKKKQ